MLTHLNDVSCLFNIYRNINVKADEQEIASLLQHATLDGATLASPPLLVFMLR